MKNLFFISVLFLSLLTNNTHAQVSIHINIGSPPVWAAPAEAHVIRYYYIPEQDCYYDAVRKGYYFNDGGRWTFTMSLPYGNFDIGSLHHVAVKYYGAQPYTYFRDQRNSYVRHYHNDWRENGYNRPNHMPPGQEKKHGDWMPPGQEKKEHGHGRGQDHGNKDKD